MDFSNPTIELYLTDSVYQNSQSTHQNKNSDTRRRRKRPWAGISILMSLQVEIIFNIRNDCARGRGHDNGEISVEACIQLFFRRMPVWILCEKFTHNIIEVLSFRDRKLPPETLSSSASVSTVFFCSFVSFTGLSPLTKLSIFDGSYIELYNTGLDNATKF